MINCYVAGFLDVSDPQSQFRTVSHDSGRTGKYRRMQRYKKKGKGKTSGSRNGCTEGYKIRMNVRLRVKLTFEVKSVTLEQTGNAEVERNVENHIKNLRDSPETSFL